MTFISYAKNLEDVMLWRALKHIDQGFYTDIGAWSPDIDSVTRAFYDAGWSGINIEPNIEFFQQLKAKRPNDMNLQVAVGDFEGVATMDFLTNPGLSTINYSIAQDHQAAGWEVFRREVELRTLATIWRKQLANEQPVHFLKVDVEGFETAVLRGNDWERCRPWIIVVEATLPMSQIDVYAEWQPILLEARYKFAYADGLNRFYVAEEHLELLSAFKYPPNVFDEFVLARHQQVEVSASQAEDRARKAEDRARKAEDSARQAEDMLTSVVSSRCWRITRPLRLLANGLRRARHEPKQALKIAFLPILSRAIQGANAHPTLKRVLLTWIQSTPRLNQRLRRLTASNMRASVESGKTDMRLNWYQSTHTQCAHLTPRARQIYSDLKAAIEKNTREAG